MLSKLASLTLVAALVTSLCATSSFAQSSFNANSKFDQPQSQPIISEKADRTAAAEKLRIDVSKLVAEAKAGKVAPATRSQIQPAKSNSLSKGKKIAIGVGIAIAVIAVIVIAKSPALHDGQ